MIEHNYSVCFAVRAALTESVTEAILLHYTCTNIILLSHFASCVLAQITGVHFLLIALRFPVLWSL